MYVCIFLSRSPILIRPHFHSDLRDGTNFGCIFDGVTAGGKINAYAAQAFSDFVLGWLSQKHHLFRSSDRIRNAELARSIMSSATQGSHNPVHRNLEYEAEGGGATGAFVTFQKLSANTAMLHGASVGDSAVIVVHQRQGMARQINTVLRKHDRDTGGQLTMCIGIDGPVWYLCEEVTADEMVILSTDGLTDNLYLPELDRIVPLLICARLFDDTVKFECDEVQEHQRKPALAYLLSIVKVDGLDALVQVTCHKAAVRLFNYVEWVTRSFFKQEELYYENCLQMNALQTSPDRESAEVQREVETLKAETESMAAQRRATAKAAKTDDAMIVAIKPFNSLS